MRAQLATVDLVLRIDDVCRLLKISRSSFYELRARGWFGSKGPALIEVLPPIDASPRFSGEPFVQFLSDRNQSRLLREDLQAVGGAR